MAAVRGKKEESNGSKMREEEEEKEDGEENILYDLLINTEWPPEFEVQVSLFAVVARALTRLQGGETRHVGGERSGREKGPRVIDFFLRAATCLCPNLDSVALGDLEQECPRCKNAWFA